MDEVGDTRVWDPFMRIFHWLLVMAFFAAYFVEPEQSAMHALARCSVLGLVLVSLVWGVVGSEHARFSDFVLSGARSSWNTGPPAAQATSGESDSLRRYAAAVTAAIVPMPLEEIDRRTHLVRQIGSARIEQPCGGLEIGGGDPILGE